MLHVFLRHRRRHTGLSLRRIVTMSLALIAAGLYLLLR